MQRSLTDAELRVLDAAASKCTIVFAEDAEVAQKRHPRITDATADLIKTANNRARGSRGNFQVFDLRNGEQVVLVAPLVGRPIALSETIWASGGSERKLSSSIVAEAKKTRTFAGWVAARQQFLVLTAGVAFTLAIAAAILSMFHVHANVSATLWVAAIVLVTLWPLGFGQLHVRQLEHAFTELGIT